MDLNLRLLKKDHMNNKHPQIEASEYFKNNCNHMKHLLSFLLVMKPYRKKVS